MLRVVIVSVTLSGDDNDNDKRPTHRDVLFKN